MSVSTIWSRDVDCKLSTSSPIPWETVLELKKNIFNIFYDLHYTHVHVWKTVHVYAALLIAYSEFAYRQTGRMLRKSGGATCIISPQSNKPSIHKSSQFLHVK